MNSESRNKVEYDGFVHNERQAYLAAWANLSPRQREAMRRRGINGPDLGDPLHPETDEVLFAGGDAAELFENSLEMATPVDELGKALDSGAPIVSERMGVSRELAEKILLWHRERVDEAVHVEMEAKLRRLIGMMLEKGSNLAIRCHGLAHAARLAASSGFPSMWASARALGCSQEAIRKAAMAWVKALNLPPLEGGKSQQARRAYAADKTKNHWRKKKCTLEKLKSVLPNESASPSSAD